MQNDHNCSTKQQQRDQKQTQRLLKEHKWPQRWRNTERCTTISKKHKIWRRVQSNVRQQKNKLTNYKETIFLGWCCSTSAVALVTCFLSLYFLEIYWQAFFLWKQAFWKHFSTLVWLLCCFRDFCANMPGKQMSEQTIKVSKTQVGPWNS